MVSALAYRFADALVGALPERWSDRLARGLARAVHRAHVPARGALERNLLRLEGLDAARLARRSRQTFEEFALVVADFLRLARLERHERERRVEVHGLEHLEAARASGRGCIVLSVHAGCWEWGAAFLAARGLPMWILARPHANERVERFFERRRASWGVRSLHGSPMWIGAAHALRRGEWIAMMGDRAVPELHRSPCALAAALARRTGALLLPVVMTRTPGGRHALWCDAPLTPAPPSDGGIREALRRHLRRAPGQWFAFAPLPEGLA